MLLSWKHKFLFIHVAKTGGTALSQALTPYARFEDRLAYDGLGVPGMKKALGLAARGGDAIEKFSGLHAHARYYEIENAFGKDKLDPLFKFAFVRNPYTRTYSLYSHLRRTPGHHWYSLIKDQSFEEALPLMIEQDWVTQAPFFCQMPRREMRANFVGAFEAMGRDVAHVERRPGLEEKLKLERVNFDPKPMPRLRDLFGDQFKPFRKATRHEFEMFGYSMNINHAHMPPETGAVACSVEKPETA